MKQNKIRCQAPARQEGKESGFTMMELVIVIIAFGVIGTITVGILNSAANFYFNVLNRQTVISNNRAALWRMTREIALQKDWNNLEVATEKGLRLVTPRNDTLNYSLAEDKISLSKNYSIAHKLAADVVSGQSYINYEDIAGNSLGIFPLDTNDLKRVWLINVRIMTALGKDTLTLQSAIFPKNLHYGEIMPYHTAIKSINH